MKVYYNSKIAKICTLLNDTDTCMFFGTVHTEHSTMSDQTKCHEGVHVYQYWHCFIASVIISVVLMFAFGFQAWTLYTLITAPVMYYLLYFGEALISLAYHRLIRREGKHVSFEKCYLNNAFEQEAYALDREYLKPCSERKLPYSFSWCKYYSLKNI